MLPKDWHTHPFSHGEEELKPCQNYSILHRYVQSAERAGLQGIGFTDHEMHISEFDFDSMYRIKERSSIDVDIGIEFDYSPGRENEISEILNEYPLEYCIGSVHDLGGWNFDNPNYKERFSHFNYRELRQVYTYYFSLVDKAVKSDLFDIIGHFDLIKIYDYHLDDREEIIRLVDPILKKMASRNIKLELNSNGLNKPAGEIYPALDIIKQARHRNVEMILSSDAHRPERVGEHFQFMNKLKEII